MITEHLFSYILPLTIFLTVAFSIAILLGFSISLWGDALAVLLVGLGSIVFQAYLLPIVDNVFLWILYSAIGTTIGVALSFGLIKLLVMYEVVKLDNSHVITFPLILFGLTLGQFFLINNTNPDFASSWMLYSSAGWVVGLIISGILGLFIDFDIEILETREKNYSVLPRWALLGFILGLSYTIATAIIL